MKLVLQNKARLLFGEVGDGVECIDEVIIVFVVIPSLLHGYPPVSLGLFFGAYLECYEVSSHVNVGVGGDVQPVLSKQLTTNYLSSMVSKKTLWSTPLGRVRRAA